MSTIKIKNKSSLITGMLLSILFLLYLPELFQYLLSIILGVNSHLEFVFIVPVVTIENTVNSSLFSQITVGFVHYLYLVVICESGSFLLGKSYVGFYRFSLIIFLLVHAGYLLFYTFFNAVVTILELTVVNDWKNIFINLSLSNLQYFIIIFLIIILTAGYLNLLSKRILKYVFIRE